MTEEIKDDSFHLAPDDSGMPWKAPHLWTSEEVHQLVMDNIGVDIMFPRGFFVLVLLHSPEKEDESGLANPDHYINNESIETSIGLILRMGNEAFTDKRLFPFGPRYTYGEWVSFRTGQRDPKIINGKRVAFINDDRFQGMTTSPKDVQSTNVEYSWGNQ